MVALQTSPKNFVWIGCTGHKIIKVCILFQLLQGSHLDTFPLRIFKLWMGSFSFINIIFSLEIINIRISPQCSHVSAMDGC